MKAVSRSTVKLHLHYYYTISFAIFLGLPNSLLTICQFPKEIGQRFPRSFVVRPKTPGDIPEDLLATATHYNPTRNSWTHQRFLYSFVPFFSIVLMNFPTAKRPSFKTGSLWFLSSFFTFSSSFSLSRTGRNFFYNVVSTIISHNIHCLGSYPSRKFFRGQRPLLFRYFSIILLLFLGWNLYRLLRLPLNLSIAPPLISVSFC